MAWLTFCLILRKSKEQLAYKWGCLPSFQGKMSYGMVSFIHSFSKWSNFKHASYICTLDSIANFLAHFEKVEKTTCLQMGLFTLPLELIWTTSLMTVSFISRNSTGNSLERWIPMCTNYLNKFACTGHARACTDHALNVQPMFTLFSCSLC